MITLLFSRAIPSPATPKPTSVSSTEVKELLEQMQSVATSAIVIPHIDQELMLKAIDVINCLSRETTFEELSDLLADLRMKGDEHVLLLDQEEKEIVELCRRAAEALDYFSRKVIEDDKKFQNIRELVEEMIGESQQH